MAMSNEDFKNALRNEISKEFSEIPKEEAIEYEFSEDFKEKIEGKILTQRKFQGSVVNSATQRIAVALIAVIFSSISAYAVGTTVIKIKNKYQLAAEQGIPLSVVDTEGNFTYTEFDESEKEVIKDKSTSKVISEIFKDPKTDIYNRMLNTFDYFNEVELTVNAAMKKNENVTIKFQTNIDEGYCYQALTENGEIITETYGSPENRFAIKVDNINKTYGFELPLLKRSDAPYIPLDERVFPNETDNLPSFKYRRNITNCPLAEYALYPQGMVYSYLADFEAWDITEDNKVYLGRECVKITGKAKPFVYEKHIGDAFIMLVDKETGIMMCFEGMKNGKVEGYVRVEECYIEKTKTEIKKFNTDEYSGYTEVNLNYKSK